MQDHVAWPADAPRRLILPPPYDQCWHGAPGVMSAAVAAAPEKGAGHLLWSLRPGRRQPGRLDFALVVEPEQPLAEARLAFLAFTAAVAEAVATHAPPERPLHVLHPGGLTLDTLRLGGVRLALPDDATESGVPAWMVLGAELLADRAPLQGDAGFAPNSTSLLEEGMEDPPALIESAASWFMLLLDRWRHDGASAVIRHYAGRLPEGETMDETATWRRGPTGLTLAAALRDPARAEAVWRRPDRDGQEGGPEL